MTILGYFEIFPIFLESKKGNRGPGPIKKVAQRFWGGKKRFLAHFDLYFQKMKKNSICIFCKGHPYFQCFAARLKSFS